MISNAIKSNLTPLSDYIFGFSDLHGLIDKKYEGFQYGVTIGRRLDDKIIDGIIDGPTLEYYNYCKQTNAELAELAKKIQVSLLSIGVDSLIIQSSVIPESEGYEEYLKTLTVDISHKMLATRAGLGWIGKTDLFVSTVFGTRIRLLSLLINKKPDLDAISIDESKCGNCSICVDKCPAKAANGLKWNVNVHRDEFFNAHKCKETCSEFARNRLNLDARICGLCVCVCPIFKKKLNQTK